jgi:phosphotransferase system enzyme I (PtsI)
MAGRTLAGVPASPGIAIGTVHLLRWEVPEVPPREVAPHETEAEVARLGAAFAAAADRLYRVRERARTNAGPEEAAIFDVQLSILADADLRASVERLVRQGFAAEKAFDIVLLEWREHFTRSGSAMMRERVPDLVDVHIRVLTVLLGLPDHDPVDLPAGATAILVTHDLTPSLTVQLDRGAIVGIALDEGTRTSHVAILARSLGLPAVVGLRGATGAVRAGVRAILDGTAGTLVIDPSLGEMAEAEARARRDEAAVEQLRARAGGEAVTSDGARVVLRANVDLPEEAAEAARSGAEGVGLMRTEFLVVGRPTMPDEDEQYREYARVVAAFDGAPVVIRTYDIGGDKLPVGGHPVEPNPFLGWRAIRMCLDQPDLFKVQLRALLRAATHGDLRIMLPLVVSVDEVRAARRLLADAARELGARGVPYRGDVALGVMIETPAAAVAADAFAGEADFFSIGTNDLTQYTLAVDRGNANLAGRFTPLHPAVLRLIRAATAAGHTAAREVCVCGEMASEPLMAYALIGLGVRQLSVAAPSVPVLKGIVRAIDAEAARAAVDEALATPTAASVEAVLRARLEAQVRDPLLRGRLLGLGAAR